MARTQRFQRSCISFAPLITLLNAKSSFTNGDESVGAVVSRRRHFRYAFQSSSDMSASSLLTSVKYSGCATLRLARFSAPMAWK